LDWKEQYKEKIFGISDAVRLIRSGDRIVLPGGPSLPAALLDELYNATDCFENISIYMGVTVDDLKILRPECNGKIDITAYFLRQNLRDAIKNGRHINVQAVQLSKTFDYKRDIFKPNVAIVKATPPDENGVMSLGPGCYDTVEFIDSLDRIIVQVAESLPYTYGDGMSLNIKDVSAMVIQDEECSEMLSPAEIPEESYAIAAHIAERVPDGACLQMGIGGVTNQLTKYLVDKKDLGIHTEMFAEPMMELINCGAVNNSRKTIDKGKSIYGFALGSREMYKFMGGNGDIYRRPFSYTNDPYTIGRNDNVIAINSAICVDITGQVAAEAVGMRQYSGTGGHLDFARGAQLSKGGQSFIAFNSTLTKRDGTRISKINFTLPKGSVVTTPRTDVQYIVTEYGVAFIQHESLENRAKRLIAVAHPDFRDELTYRAKKNGIIY